MQFNKYLETASFFVKNFRLTYLKRNMKVYLIKSAVIFADERHKGMPPPGCTLPPTK